MTGFLGEYEATLDSKGRFMVPGALKKQMPKGENNLIISRGIDKCLNLHPVAVWENLVKRINKLNDFDPKVRRFKMFMLGGATEVEMDSAGRILIPPSLKEHASLSRDIILASNLDKINLWDADKYKQFFEEFSTDQFSNLAAEVMGVGEINLPDLQ